jgi:23S rRNA (adenine2503-C2)-methyltransferase
MTPSRESPPAVASAPIELRGLTLAELEALTRTLDLPPFRARQVFAWIHGHGVTSTAPMTNLSKELRARLAQLGTLDGLVLDGQIVAADETRKLSLRCADGATIETVLIPEEGKLTQCVSTQIGCGLDCRFCATAAMGLRRNLSAAEIVDQVYRGRALLAGGERISNLVFMGMGEPMNNLDQVLRAIELLCADEGANFSPRRITISTAGVVPGIAELGRRARQVGLAISLNATTDEVRGRLMPVNRRWPLAALVAALRDFPLPQRRRITIEYVLIAGVNDTDADARRLPRLLDGLRVKINLIPYNAPHPDTVCEREGEPAPRSIFARPTDEAIDAFAEQLRSKDLATFVRRSRGDQIAAACGQLVARPRRT